MSFTVRQILRQWWSLEVASHVALPHNVLATRRKMWVRGTLTPMCFVQSNDLFVRVNERCLKELVGVYLVHVNNNPSPCKV